MTKCKSKKCATGEVAKQLPKVDAVLAGMTVVVALIGGTAAGQNLTDNLYMQNCMKEMQNAGICMMYRKIVHSQGE